MALPSLQEVLNTHASQSSTPLHEPLTCHALASGLLVRLTLTSMSSNCSRTSFHMGLPGCFVSSLCPNVSRASVTYNNSSSC